RRVSGHLPRRNQVLARLDVLRRRHDFIAGQPWVLEYLDDLNGIRTALRTAVADRTHMLIGHCHLPVEGERCRGALLAENGTGLVRCRSCGARWSTPQELARLRVTLS
ncbi:MAG: hypothetical protein ACRDNS_13545, partial [Trebonia sp.]